jgi:hypothetical protein
MHQAEAMHFVARTASDDLIALVDDIEDFSHDLNLSLGIE